MLKRSTWRLLQTSIFPNCNRPGVCTPVLDLHHYQHLIQSTESLEPNLPISFLNLKPCLSYLCPYISTLPRHSAWNKLLSLPSAWIFRLVIVNVGRIKHHSNLHSLQRLVQLFGSLTCREKPQLSASIGVCGDFSQRILQRLWWRR